MSSQIEKVMMSKTTTYVLAALVFIVLILLLADMYKPLSDNSSEETSHEESSCQPRRSCSVCDSNREYITTIGQLPIEEKFEEPNPFIGIQVEKFEEPNPFIGSQVEKFEGMNGECKELCAAYKKVFLYNLLL